MPVAFIVIAVAIAAVVGVLILAPSMFGPPPVEPACTLRGVTTPAAVLVELRERDGAGGATVVASTTSNETGAYSVVVPCRVGTPYDAKASKAGYFFALLESLPFSTDRPTTFDWSPTLTKAP